MSLIAKLEQIHKNARAAVADATSLESVDQVRVRFLGRKGEITAILRGLKDLSVKERKTIGGQANKIKSDLEMLLGQKKDELEGKQKSTTRIDHTLPGRPYYCGHKHIITQAMDEICGIFQRMGFEIADGPEIETDYYNFGALNFPEDHPARDEQDTFFVEGGLLLRTHTSPVQIREFEKRTPPVKILCPGRVFRNEAVNARSYCVFHQVEGFLVDTNVTFADMKGALLSFCYEYFGKDVKLRFRPSFFPFTEPSAEVDISCFLCGGKGCSVCKHEGWLEILGCGMIDPNVLACVNYDSEKYSGYAFGIGVERPALLRYRINDIRLLFENDIRFIRQFR